MRGHQRVSLTSAAPRFCDTQLLHPRNPDTPRNDIKHPMESFRRTSTRSRGADRGAELLRGGDLPERGEGARRGLAHGEALVQERVRQRPERQVRLRERGRESSR